VITIEESDDKSAKIIVPDQDEVQSATISVSLFSLKKNHKLDKFLEYNN